MIINTDERAIQLPTFLQNRKPTLQQLIAFAQQLIEGKKGDTLTQRMGILNSSTRSLLYVVRQLLESLNNFKYEICYKPVRSQVKRTQRRKSTVIANHSRNQQNATHKKQISIDDMLTQSIQRSIAQSNSSVKATPKRQFTNSQQLFTPNFPPVHTEPISQQHFSATGEDYRYRKIGTAATAAEQKMMTYHKFLAVDNQPLNVTRAPSLFITRRKRTSTNRKVLFQRDDDIYLSEVGSIQKKLQQLSTKIKISRQQKAEQVQAFENQIKNFDPRLMNNEILKDRLKLAISQFQNKEKEGNFENYRTQDFDRSFMQQNNTERKFIINETNSPTITTAIQSKLSAILETEQLMEPQVNFQHFCRKRNIKSAIKGQLFYQILHMDLPLEQQTPEQFSDIFINKK